MTIIEGMTSVMGIIKKISKGLVYFIITMIIIMNTMMLIIHQKILQRLAQEARK